MAFLSNLGNFISSNFPLCGISKIFLLYASPKINTEVSPYILNNFYQQNLNFDPILH